MENFGKRLRRLRKERGLTQDDIAAAIGVSRQIISRWERNEAVPKAGNLTALADTLGISADYLLHGKTNFPATPPEVPVEVPLNEPILEIAELAEAVLATEEPNAPFLTVTSVPAPEVLSLLSENNFEEEIAEKKKRLRLTLLEKIVIALSTLIIAILSIIFAFIAIILSKMPVWAVEAVPDHLVFISYDSLFILGTIIVVWIIAIVFLAITKIKKRKKLKKNENENKN